MSIITKQGQILYEKHILNSFILTLQKNIDKRGSEIHQENLVVVIQMLCFLCENNVSIKDRPKDAKTLGKNIRGFRRLYKRVVPKQDMLAFNTVYKLISLIVPELRLN